MPTCALAIAESERAMPGVIRQIEKELAQLGLSEEKICIRMTGCPNGCARPYTSEIGLVGSGIGAYAVFVAGNFEETRLNQELFQKVKKDDVVPMLVTLFETFKKERKPKEAFGDFCFRQGIDKLRSLFNTAVKQ
jgi:sulfite reductase (ferredoxin)